MNNGNAGNQGDVARADVRREQQAGIFIGAEIADEKGQRVGAGEGEAMIGNGGEMGQKSDREVTGEGLKNRDEQEVEQARISPEREALERLGQMGADGTVSLAVLPDDIVVDTGTVDDINPLTATDSDQIERVWAERIQKIIALTKDNPRVEQIEINKLKADYLKKRFNREIGDRN